MTTLLACIAANALTSAVVNSVLLRPLPVPEAESIVLLASRYPKAGDYIDRQTPLQGLADQALFRRRSRTWTSTAPRNGRRV